MCSYQIFLEFKKFGSGQILNFQIFWTTYFTALKNQSLDLQLLMKKELTDCHHEIFKGIVILSAQARNYTI